MVYGADARSRTANLMLTRQLIYLLSYVGAEQLRPGFVGAWHPKDVIVHRWQDWTGKTATRESDGVAFDALAAGSPAGPGAPEEGSPFRVIGVQNL